MARKKGKEGEKKKGDLKQWRENLNNE